MKRVKAGEPMKEIQTPKEKAEAKAKKIRLYLSIATIILTAIGAITFGEFIYEEALQQIGMSCFVLRSVGTAEEIQECGTLLREEGERVASFVEKVGWLNPLTFGAFRKFAASTIVQGRAYEKLGDYKAPQASRPSLPYDSDDEQEEYERLCNGTSCHLLKQ